MQQNGQRPFKQSQHVESEQMEVASQDHAAWAQQPWQDATGNGQIDDIVGYLPRYALPNISSLLPAYINAEQDLIHRSFHTGNYDYLKHLPDEIKHQQVAENRTARMQSARTTGILPSMGCTSSTRSVQGPSSNIQGLFQAFEYQSSPFDLEQQLDAQAKSESEAKRLAVGGKEFTPAGIINTAKHENLGTAVGTYAYLGGSYEAIDDTIRAHRTIEEAKQLGGAFKSPGVEKLTDKPTRHRAWDMMNNLRNCVLKDWEACQVSIFENEEDCWVVRVGLEGVDNLEGLRAYMNVLVRCNPLVLEYRLVKVPEFWHTQPGDGGVYYMLRPPWVRQDALHAFYTMHPEEKQFGTSQAAKDLTAWLKRQAEDDKRGGKRPGTSVTVLSRDSRLAWGTNCITGTAGTAGQGRGWGP